MRVRSQISPSAPSPWALARLLTKVHGLSPSCTHLDTLLFPTTTQGKQMSQSNPYRLLVLQGQFFSHGLHLVKFSVAQGANPSECFAVTAHRSAYIGRRGQNGA